MTDPRLKAKDRKHRTQQRRQKGVTSYSAELRWCETATGRCNPEHHRMHHSRCTLGALLKASENTLATLKASGSTTQRPQESTLATWTCGTTRGVLKEKTSVEVFSKRRWELRQFRSHGGHQAGSDIEFFILEVVNLYHRRFFVLCAVCVFPKLCTIFTHVVVLEFVTGRKRVVAVGKMVHKNRNGTRRRIRKNCQGGARTFLSSRESIAF